MAFPQTVTELISDGYFEILNEKENERKRKMLAYCTRKTGLAELMEIVEKAKEKEREKNLKALRIALQVDDSEKADCFPKHKSKAVLPVEETLNKQEGKKTKNKVSSTPDNNILDPEKTPTIDLKVLGKYLPGGWSASIIEKGKWKSIPKKCWAEKGYAKKPRQYKFLTKEIIAWNKAGRQPPSPNEAPTEKPETSPSKKETPPNYQFSFKAVPLKHFINILVNNEYLDEENAKLFVDRFKSCLLYNDYPKIEWKKNLNSLLTLILVSSKFEWIDENKTKERYNNMFSEFISPLNPFVDNFNRKKGWNESDVSKQRKKIMNFLDEIGERVKPYNKNEEALEKRLDLFFQNNLTIENKTGIDWELLVNLYNLNKEIKHQ